MKKLFKTALYLTLIVLTVSFLLTGCVFLNLSNDVPGGNAIQAKGDREDYEIRVGAFNKIKIEGACEIYYNRGNSDTVTLSVQPNIREYIDVFVVNSELIIQPNRNINYRLNNRPVLTVYTPLLNQVTIEGTGAFTANDKITADSFTLNIAGAGSGTAELEVNTLDVIFSGAGDVKLSGKAENSTVTVSGTGGYDALSLLTKDSVINLSGAGAVKVNSTGTLSINAGGAGSIEYKGSPALQLNTNGLVKIKNLN